MPALPFSFQTNPGRHPSGGVARLVNCYGAEVGEGQRARLVIYASDGLGTFATHSAAAGTRLLFPADSYLYALCGRVLSRFDSLGSETVIGGIPSDGAVFAARNRRSPGGEIGITVGGLFYIVAGTTLTRVTDADLTGAPVGICFLAGYFILPCSDGRFFWTGIDDGSAVAALDFASAEANPDGGMAAKARGDDLVLFGTRSTEFHRLTGDAASPFARSSVINVGCLSAASVTEIAVVSATSVSDTIGWVAADRQGRAAGVVLLEGNTARKISPEWLDILIESDAAKADIEGTTWVRGGHSFYALTGSTWTAVFDTATGLWHSRESYGDSRWDVTQVVDFNGTLIAGTRTGGTMYKMGPDYHADGSDPLVMTAQSSPIAGEADYNELELMIATGVGTLADTDPQVTMCWSDDGENWSGERARSLGAMAQSDAIVRWHRMGTNRSGRGGRSFRFRSSAAVTRIIYGAEINPR